VIRRLDIGQRNETLFSERTHSHRESSQNSIQLNLRAVNRNPESNNSLLMSLFTDDDSLVIDFNKLI
jgi:hypothetical protein